MSSDRIFLTAEWRNLAMLNYEVEPGLLSRYVPSGTELDRWNGKVFVSLVGFRFLNTKVCGFSIPFHRNFDEVNLRFYVRGRNVNEIRRGVVFVREIVPRRAIAAVARGIYNERYVARRMKHRVETSEEIGVFAEYGWRLGKGWNRISVSAVGQPEVPEMDSEERFITEHYWGYSTQRDGGTAEYRVAHPVWRVWKRCDAKFTGDATELYGPELAEILLKPPCSAFLAEGSEVTVFRGQSM
jgi:uncharacterized protein